MDKAGDYYSTANISASSSLVFAQAVFPQPVVPTVQVYQLHVSKLICTAMASVEVCTYYFSVIFSDCILIYVTTHTFIYRR